LVLFFLSADGCRENDLFVFLRPLVSLKSSPASPLWPSALYLAGVTVGERQSRVALPRREQALAAAGTFGN